MSETVREMLTDGFGGRLAQWRRRRRMSQLGLALEAGISSRHLSFVETGRSRPSREMVLLLYGALDVPLREQNDLLLAAGFAPVRRETPLDAAPMEGMLAALRLILARHDPFGAVALDRNWDIVMASAAYAAVVNECRLPAESGRPLATLVTPLGLTAPPRPNMLRLLCHPAGYRRRVVNWQAVTSAVLARVARGGAGDDASDAARRALLHEVLAYPDLPAPPYALPGGNPPLVIPVELSDGDGGTWRLLSTIATLGTAEDITLRELRIEAFYPADAETDRRAQHAASVTALPETAR